MSDQQEVKHLFDVGQRMLTPTIKVGRVSVTIDTAFDLDKEYRLGDFDADDDAREFIKEDGMDNMSVHANVSWKIEDRITEVWNHSISEILDYMRDQSYVKRVAGWGSEERGYKSALYPSSVELRFWQAAEAFKKACVDFVIEQDTTAVRNA